MKLFKRFSDVRPILGLDITARSIKAAVIDRSSERPVINVAAMGRIEGEVFSNTFVSNPEKLSEQITTFLEAHSIPSGDVALALPTPSAFVKRIQMAEMSADELADTIALEAANYIPHEIDDVRLDYQVMRIIENGQMEVLLIAVKNEIIDSYLETLQLAGLEPVIVDLDLFSFQTAFETTHPERISETTALVDVGERFTGISICTGGDCLFTGDIGVGGASMTEQLSKALGVSISEAESIKCTRGKNSSIDGTRLGEAFDKVMEGAASELFRQLSFYWNATGRDEGIDRIVITGGGSLLKGLTEELSAKSGVPVEQFSPMNGMDVDGSIDKVFLEGITPSLSVALGVALREPGDKVWPEGM